jgi:SET domain-containing protein
MARFMNHCCEPNAIARIITLPPSSTSSSAEGSKHIAIIAARDIAPGEEITYDYKFPIEDTKLQCFCGAPRCSGSMN